jgi:hypothetical protein
LLAAYVVYGGTGVKALDRRDQQDVTMFSLQHPGQEQAGEVSQRQDVDIQQLALAFPGNGWHNRRKWQTRHC